MKIIDRSPLIISRLPVHVAKGATGSLIIQLVFAGLSFVNAMLLGRLLGPEGYGAFANAMAWISILVVISTFGFGILIVKEIAILKSREEWQIFKGLIIFTDRFVLFLSFLFCICFVFISGIMYSSKAQETLRLTLWMSAPLISLLALSNLRMSAIRGLEHVIRARLPTMIFRPAILTMGIILVYFIVPDKLSAPIAMLINIFAALFALTISLLWLKYLLPFENHLYKGEYKVNYWLRSAFPLLIFNSIQIILAQTDIVMLGILGDASDVGLYAAANRLAYTLTFLTVAMDVIMAPIIARLYANHEKQRLQKLITYMVRITFAIVLPFGLILIVNGEDILALFGPDFVIAQTALVILAIGRVIEIALGSSGLMLSMIGYEDIVAKSYGITFLMNVGLNFLLIPKFGLVGAAVSSAISFIFVRVLLSVFALKRAGLQVSIFVFH